MNFQILKLVLNKAEEPEIKLPTSAGSWKKQESSRKTSISALLTMPKPLCESGSVVPNSLRPHGLYSPLNSPSQNTGVGSLSLLQGIFPTQGSHPGILHCRWILYQLSHQGSPRILEWLAFPFSRGLPDPGIKPGSPAWQADSLDCVDHNKLWKILKEMGIPDHTWPAS